MMPNSLQIHLSGNSNSPEALNDKGAYTGFDLVVANPPYIGMQGHTDIFESVAQTTFGEQWSKGKIDFFYYFIHLAIDLLNKNGSLAFITTNYWLTATDGATLRNDLISRMHLTGLLNFKELKIFSSALGKHEDSKTDYGLVPQNDLQDQSTGYFVLDSASRDGSLTALIVKLKSQKKLLSYTEKPKLGLTTGSNKIFIWKKADVEAMSMTDYEHNLFKPLINGSSLTMVTEKDFPDSYVMYINHTVDEENIPNLSKWIKSQPAYDNLMKRREVISGRIRSFELW